MRDDLTPLLERLAAADAVVLGTPVYLGTGTGEMRSFLERLVFPYLTYTDPPGTLFPRSMRIGLIFTLGAPEAMAAQMGFDRHIAMTEMLMTRIFGPAETVCSYDTLQFDNYDDYVAPRFDPEKKRARRREVFPEDCRKAWEMGIRLAGG